MGGHLSTESLSRGNVKASNEMKMIYFQKYRYFPLFEIQKVNKYSWKSMYLRDFYESNKRIIFMHRNWFQILQETFFEKKDDISLLAKLKFTFLNSLYFLSGQKNSMLKISNESKVIGLRLETPVFLVGSIIIDKINGWFVL